MGKKLVTKIVKIFSKSQKDVRGYVGRDRDYKNYIIKKIKQTGKDEQGLKNIL